MVKALENNQVVVAPVRARIRLDYKGTGKKALFGGKTPEKVAEEIRDQQAAFVSPLRPCGPTFPILSKGFLSPCPGQAP